MNTNETYRYPVALTIAGSDSGGGAGIQADIKTFSALGVFATSAITAITAQNTCGVRGIQPVTPELLQAQITAILDDFTVDAIKIGMLHNKEVVRVVADLLAPLPSIPIILDPVMISTSGSKLIEDEAIQGVIEELFPIATLVTPNIPETEFLSGHRIGSEADISFAAGLLMEAGAQAVLVKGGHIGGDKMTDWLFQGNEPPQRFTSPSIRTGNTHGTGCTLSSAIAAYMALGKTRTEAVRSAKEYMNKALAQGANVRMGKGHGPVNHFFAPLPLRKI